MPKFLLRAPFKALAFLLLASGYSYGQGNSCSIGPQGRLGRIECDQGDGCWVFRHNTERDSVIAQTGGCLLPSGREALFELVSGTFKDVPLGEAVNHLLRGTDVRVKILGDKAKKISLNYKQRPLQLVLLDLQGISGAVFETTWLPRLKEGEKFSFGAQARADKLALLFYAIRGRPVEIPSDKMNKRVVLNLVDVTLEQVAQELIRAVQ